MIVREFIREKQLSTGWSLLVAAAAFLCLFAVANAVIVGLLIQGGWWFEGTGLLGRRPNPIWAATVTAVSVVVAYLLARRVFISLRGRTFMIHLRNCSECGYGFTVNMSGRNASCLHPITHCRKCGYDLTGNVSGRCPECGKAI